MGLDEVVQLILSVRKGLTREEVLRLVEEKKREAEGYFTDEGAARVVASDLGVDVPQKPFRSKVLIRDLISGLSDVTVTGRVITVYPPKVFLRSDGTRGKVARLLIADESETLRVALWDDKADLVEAGKIEGGQIVRFSHGYTREGLDGRLELQMGLRGDIQVSPPEAVEKEYPPVTKFFQKIGDITKEHRRVNVLGVVERVNPPSTFKRRDGTEGKVQRVQLRDESGRITVVFWDQKVEELGDMEKGTYLQIMDAEVKKNVDGQLEIHTRNGTQIEKIRGESSRLGPLPFRFLKIGELKPKMRDIDLLARVTHTGEIREFPRRYGEMGRVATLLIGDETGSIRLNLWEDKVETAKKIQSGNILLIQGAYTRERFGELNLNLGQRGSLTLNPNIAEAKGLQLLEGRITPIKELKREGGPVTVEGTIATTPTTREIVTARGQRVKVASLDREDETGKVRVSLWRSLADQVENLKAEDKIRIENAYVKRGLSDQLELTSSTLTTVKPRSSKSEE
ncbi:MAG: OB-fold nucleic acid binding domain-containing protein [Candidatus Bathyarchaeia archaeon]